MERDIAGAKKLGIKTAWAKYGHNKLGEKVDAHHILKRFEDLVEVIKCDSENG
ncbi:MAG: hypothetical protein ABIC91_05385 [Nanoarchaeota archaeon]|nr:hypothetical protein [Nanoarchaeota archaeon]MBU1030242.1 hypothetical protein [Nanoarchaeota archaeon]MBU1849437.1 hypothetical protein [Nanoarchaeota archaeon]